MKRSVIQSRVQRSVTMFCAAGPLTLSVVSGAWAGSVPPGVTGGQAGAHTSNYDFSPLGAAAGNGGQGGCNYYGHNPSPCTSTTGNNAGSVGSAGMGGSGGNGVPMKSKTSNSTSGGAGGPRGWFVTSSSTVTGATGVAGNPGASAEYASGAGGGGGGDGLVIPSSGFTITHPIGYTIQGGAGGAGGDSGIGRTHGSSNPQPAYYGGAGGGGGNGVEFLSLGGTLFNYGIIKGGPGGATGAANAKYMSATGSGGGHGVVGAGITITTSGTIAAGAAGGYGSSGKHSPAGTAGDAILFTGGSNALNLLTGSTITGAIELATATSTTIAAQDDGLTLSSHTVLDANTSALQFDTTLAGLTVSGSIAGAGTVSLSGVPENPLILTAGNSFSGGTTVNSGELHIAGSIGAVTLDAGVLQVDGSSGNATIGTGILRGVGTVGTITTVSGSTIAPGNAASMFGALNSGTTTFASGSTLQIVSTDGRACSSLNSSGTMNLNGTLHVHFENTPMIGNVCTIANAAGDVNLSFATIETAPATVQIVYNTTSITITVTGNSDSVFADGFDGGAR